MSTRNNPKCLILSWLVDWLISVWSRALGRPNNLTVPVYNIDQGSVHLVVWCLWSLILLVSILVLRRLGTCWMHGEWVNISSIIYISTCWWGHHVVVRGSFMKWSTGSHCADLHSLVRDERREGCWEETMTDSDWGTLIVVDPKIISSWLIFVQILDATDLVQVLNQVTIGVILILKDRETLSHAWLICHLTTCKSPMFILGRSSRSYISRLAPITAIEYKSSADCI